MTNIARHQRYDLADRTTNFGKSVVSFCLKVPKNAITTPLLTQLVRSGTSVGANYAEADDAVSKKEFRNKIGTCKKEARETKYWLEMIVTADPNSKAEARKLWQEAKELHLIFAAIWRKG
jgi:four helix bundle protein